LRSFIVYLYARQQACELNIYNNNDIKGVHETSTFIVVTLFES